jgi:hypothetical protein
VTITENSGHILFFRNVCKSWLDFGERDGGVQLEPSSHSLASKDEGRAMPGALIITTITIEEHQSTTDPAT